MALMTGLKNINDVMSLTKNDHVIMYGNKNFDNHECKNTYTGYQIH